jgi:hypothetical protein
VPVTGIRPQAPPYLVAELDGATVGYGNARTYRAIDVDVPASHKSSICLRRIVGEMFMRVNLMCAHHRRLKKTVLPEYPWVLVQTLDLNQVALSFDSATFFQPRHQRPAPTAPAPRRRPPRHRR